jgi:hypothetical protein
MIESEAAFLTDYGSAIVRFATCRPDNKKAQPALLVFASLEFVHCDRPAPDSTPLDDKGIPPKTQSRGPARSQVYFRRVAMSAPEALAWYRQAIEGKVTSPFAADLADRGPHDGGSLRAPLLLEEPPWPQWRSQSAIIRSLVVNRTIRRRLSALAQRPHAFTASCRRLTPTSKSSPTIWPSVIGCRPASIFESTTILSFWGVSY